MTENFSVTYTVVKLALELPSRPYSLMSLQEITLPADLLLVFINFSTKILEIDGFLMIIKPDWSSK